jgi:hypothetical protein
LKLKSKFKNNQLLGGEEEIEPFVFLLKQPGSPLKDFSAANNIWVSRHLSEQIPDDESLSECIKAMDKLVQKSFKHKKAKLFL